MILRIITFIKDLSRNTTPPPPPFQVCHTAGGLSCPAGNGAAMTPLLVMKFVIGSRNYTYIYIRSRINNIDSIFERTMDN